MYTINVGFTFRIIHPYRMVSLRPHAPELGDPMLKRLIQSADARVTVSSPNSRHRWYMGVAVQRNLFQVINVRVQLINKDCVQKKSAKEYLPASNDFFARQGRGLDAP